MKHIRSYLTFSGNCREAMNFYKDCLGGELNFQTIGDSPLAGKMPEKMHQWILHATLTHGNTVLMGTDMVQEEGRIRGNAVSLMLDCSSEEEARTAFNKLSSGGEVLHPLETSFWGALFGDLKDKYGNTWLLQFDRNS
jgi:PhnB protein